MSVPISEFRQNFPEFADTTKYPDWMVELWMRWAVIRLPEQRWLDLLPMGIQLFTAHNLVLAARAVQAAATGATPGVVTGPVSSKSVDKVSVGYDVGTVALTDGGFWNMTTYGVQFLQLARMVGAGGVQL